MQTQSQPGGMVERRATHQFGRSLTFADLCLCLVPISLFLSIMSLV